MCLSRVEECLRKDSVAVRGYCFVVVFLPMLRGL